MKHIYSIIRPVVHFLGRHNRILILLLAIPIVVGFLWGVNRSNEMSSGWTENLGVVIEAGTQPVSGDDPELTQSLVSYPAGDGSTFDSEELMLPWQLREGNKVPLWIKGEQVVASDPGRPYDVIFLGSAYGLIATAVLLVVALMLVSRLKYHDGTELRLELLELCEEHGDLVVTRHDAELAQLALFWAGDFFDRNFPRTEEATLRELTRFIKYYSRDGKNVVRLVVRKLRQQGATEMNWRDVTLCKEGAPEGAEWVRI